MVKLDRSKRRVVHGAAAEMKAETLVEERGEFYVRSMPLKVRPMLTVGNPGHAERGALVRIALPPDAVAEEEEQLRKAAEFMGVAGVKVDASARRGLAASTLKTTSASEAVKGEIEKVPEAARDAVRPIVLEVAGRHGL